VDVFSLHRVHLRVGHYVKYSYCCSAQWLCVSVFVSVCVCVTEHLPVCTRVCVCVRERLACVHTCVCVKFFHTLFQGRRSHFIVGGDNTRSEEHTSELQSHL